MSKKNMISKVEIIAKSTNDLKKFLFDFCGFTLEKTGLDPKIYGFYLHVAFRHQCIIQADEWSSICQQITEENPLEWNKPSQQILLNRIEKFAQSIVTEVSQAKEDNWSVKLIKTSYLSHLDAAKISCDRAMKLLNSDNWQNLSTLALSDLSYREEESIQIFTDAIKTEGEYLDSLIDLPFVLEAFCLGLSANKQINYQPRKTAAMLSAVIDTMQEGLNLGDTVVEKGLIWSLKKALEIVMPNLPIDQELTQIIEEKLLPYIKKGMAHAKLAKTKQDLILERQKQETDTPKTKARLRMLATLGVHFDSLQTILTKTLLEPVILCNEASLGIASLTSGTIDFIFEENLINKMDKIKDIFMDFDNLATLASTKSAFMPEWLKNANGYYQHFKVQSAPIEAGTVQVLNGLGAFYNYAKSFIPDAVLYYFSSTDALTQMLSTIDKEPNHFDIDKIMVYFAFFAEMNLCDLDEPLKQKFFAAFMGEVYKKNDKCKQEFYDYPTYKNLEVQFKEKQIDLQQPLNILLSNFNRISDLTASLRKPLQEVLGIENRQKFEIFLLLNRLQKLEKDFDSLNTEAIFNELIQAVTLIETHPALQIFCEKFLKPAIERLLTLYKNKTIIPLLEKWIDDDYPQFISERHNLQAMYSKLSMGTTWSLGVGFNQSEWKSLEYCWNLSVVSVESPTAFKNFKKIAHILPLETKLEFSLKETPKETHIKNLQLTMREYIFPTMDTVFSVLQERLNNQEILCRQFKKLSSDSNLLDLNTKKMHYIKTLHTLINTLRLEIKNPTSNALNFFTDLVSGKAPGMIKDQILTTFPLTSLPGKFLQFVWHVLPSTAGKQECINETFIANFLDYYLKNTKPGNLIEAEKAYNLALNANPAPALMPILDDPLGLPNIIPDQEKMVDFLVDKLLKESGKTAVSWGFDYLEYLKKVVDTVAYEHLIKVLPYPFLADLTLQTLKSSRIQTLLAPLIQSLMDKYGHVVTEKATFLRQAAKSSIYPLLGIELQKTVEQSAYHYILNPDRATESERDAFALFYLKYREIQPKQGKSKATIRYLFPELLATMGEEENLIIEKISAKFKALMECELTINQTVAANNLVETERQLQFLINAMNFNDPANDAFIRLTIINRFLIQIMDSARTLSGPGKEDLERIAIENLSAVLKKIKAIKPALDNDKEGLESDVEEEGFLIIDRNRLKQTSAIQIVSKAKQQAKELAVDRLENRIQAVKGLVKSQAIVHEEMLNKKESLLGFTLLEWDYNQSTTAKKVAFFLSQIASAISFAITWSAFLTSVLAGSGFLQPLLVFLGASAAVGSAATLIGAIVFGAVACIRILVKFGKEIFDHRQEFNEINDVNKHPSILVRIGLNLLLGLKCLFFAVVKAIFSDFIGEKLSAMFAVEPISKLNNALQKWPTEEVVIEEKAALDDLQNSIKQLSALIQKQKNPKPEKILQACTLLNEKLSTTEKILLKVAKNDARFVRENYQTTLDNYQEGFRALRDEIKQIKTLLKVQINWQEDLPIVRAEVTKEALTEDLHREKKAISVSLVAYRLLQIEAQKQQDGPLENPGLFNQLLSPVWNYLLGGNEKIEDKQLDSSRNFMADSFIQSSLTASSFFEMERSMDFVMVESPLTTSTSPSFFNKKKMKDCEATLSLSNGLM